MPHWKLEDAKAQFSRVVREAMRGEAQYVTKHGQEAVVVLSSTAYAALLARASGSDAAPSRHLVDVLLAANLQPGELDLRRDKSDTVRDCFPDLTDTTAEPVQADATGRPDVAS